MSDAPQDQSKSAVLPPPNPFPGAAPPSASPAVPPPPNMLHGSVAPPGTAPVPPPPNMLHGPVALRPGQLPISWQIFMSLAGTAAFFAFAAVWKTSEEIGIGTWWLGASSSPQPMIIRLLPFVVALVISLAAIYNVRRTALISAAGSIVCAVLAVLDMSRSGGLAAIEFAIAGSLLLISIGAQIGTIRPVDET